MKNTPLLHLASLITAPPDECEDCHQPNILPAYSWLGGPLFDTIYGRYNCPPCGISWDTGWKVENL